ncbi:MAG: hypothetical protein KGL39_13100 [Patescibacteria group bacterium]|nr:hypothetical protein [Patescibacteria group bacterium]
MSETKDDCVMAPSAVTPKATARPKRPEMLIGGVPRIRVYCTLRLDKSGKTLILTDPNGDECRFKIKPVEVPKSSGRVDIIGDISGSMGSPLANDAEIPNAVTRLRTEELVYRKIRGLFPSGSNRVFDDEIKEWEMETPLQKTGRTDLVKCLNACDPSSVTVVMTDDKGELPASTVFHEKRQKLVVVCLLTAFSIDAEYGEGTEKEKKTNLKYQRRTSGNRVATDAKTAPGFGMAMVAQRDGPGLIRIDTSYADGKISDQSDIVTRVAKAVALAQTATYWEVTNAKRSEFVVHCASGRTMVILPGTMTVVAPDKSDLGTLDAPGPKAHVYIHSPAKK